MTRRLLMIAGGAALAASLAACGPRHGDPAEFAGYVTDRISSKLDLDEAQEAKLAAAREAFLAARERGRDRREENRRELLTLLEAERLDRDRALALVKSRTAAVEEAAPEVIDAIADFYDSLRPEQQAELREHIAERMERRGRCWTRK